MKEKRYYFLALCIFFYVILFYKLGEQINLKNMIISREDLQWANLGSAWFPLVLRALLLPLLCYLPFVDCFCLINRVKKENAKIFCIFLWIIYVVFSFYRGFTPQTVYDFVVYLLLVGISEELFFRGFIYNLIKLKSYIMAVIISGAVWGMVHYPPEMMVNGFLGGIFAGWLFIMLYESSGSIWIPILVHAIWDMNIKITMKIIVVIFTILYYGFKYYKRRKIEREPEIIEI